MKEESIRITGDLPEVCISSQWHDLAKELIRIYAIDTSTPEEKQIHQLASYFQECFDAGLIQGRNEIRRKVTERLFG
jgi:hypothetical protein